MAQEGKRLTSAIAASSTFTTVSKLRREEGDNHMTADLYERLADRLNALPNGFPRTQSGVEVQLLRKIFSPEQVQIAATLSREFETPAQIAARLGRPVEEVTTMLKAMARDEMVWARRGEGGLEFRLAPFVVGIYEGQL